MNTLAKTTRLPKVPRLRLGPGNRRSRALWAVALCLLFFAGLFLLAASLGETGLSTNLGARRLAPSWAYPFGTDWLGRDMLTRTVQGLIRSLGIGLLAAGASSVIAVSLGVVSAAFGRRTDAAVTWLVDLVMSMPHLVLLILVSFMLGGGAEGVILAVAVSHWPRLARVIRAEVLQLKSADYVLLAARFGQSPLVIARKHMLPHLLPQFLVGTLLLFPHAILHAAGLTFLGFGLSPHQPSIGILLAEAMRHISTGYWWLAIIPGVALVFTVKAFDLLGNNLRTLLAPRTSQE